MQNLRKPITYCETFGEIFIWIGRNVGIKTTMVLEESPGGML